MTDAQPSPRPEAAITCPPPRGQDDRKWRTGRRPERSEGPCGLAVSVHWRRKFAGVGVLWTGRGKVLRCAQDDGNATGRPLRSPHPQWEGVLKSGKGVVASRPASCPGIVSVAASAARRGALLCLARVRRQLAILVTLLPLVTASALAVDPDEMLADKALEARARAISADVRCVVCQNQSIDESNAEIARDMRRAIRERLTKGDTDTQVVEFLRARYGDYVLLKPPFDARTWLLWLGAPLALLLAGVVLWRGARLAAARRAAGAATGELTAEERARLNV
ncbi:MAG: cytochrome c-type biogenesis protein CcmH, partial [Alphaproteobacteria bacterium]|nr:cytochrome c-type biogenesis protein CcmH [Alphaproteobacteria bacterium]